MLYFMKIYDKIKLQVNEANTLTYTEHCFSVRHPPNLH